MVRTARLAAPASPTGKVRRARAVAKVVRVGDQPASLVLRVIGRIELDGQVFESREHGMPEQFGELVRADRPDSQPPGGYACEGVLECSRQIADRLHTRAGQRVELQKSGEALGRVPPVRTTLDVQAGAQSFFQPGYVRR